MRAKSIIYGILGIILGFGLTAGGISTLLSPGPVTCGGVTMSQNDTCTTYTNGAPSSSDRDYSQQQQKQHNEGIGELIFGPLVLLGSIFLLLPGKRRSRVAARAAQPYQQPAYPPQQPGYPYPPQQPAYPPQQASYPYPPQPSYPPQQPGYPPPPRR